MNIAVVCGGERCGFLLNILETYTTSEIYAKVVVLVVENRDGPLAIAAERKGVFVTEDYSDLFQRDDIDVIVELSGNENIYKDLLLKKKPHVQILDHRTGEFFCEGIQGFFLWGQARQELEKLRMNYDAVINAFSQEDVLMISPRYDILDINTAMARRLGLTRDEVMGKHCYEISHGRSSPCTGKEHPCPFQQCLETRQYSQVTHVHTDKLGRKLFFSISCYPIFENSEIVGAVEISKDITKDINFEKNLMHQQKMASIGHLAAGVAHEINNPLTTILTTAMLIQEDMSQNDPNYQELQTIANETLRCRKIVTSLLDFARQNKPTRADHHINEIVRDSMALTRKKAAFKDVTYGSNLTENLPLVYVDRDQIQQALVNLALNAAEATDAGGKITFSTRLTPENGFIEVAVSDTGVGIPEDFLEQIFEPFFTTKERGTGLGLAITHGIIERHGGTIQVESKEGKGTTFRIKLPTKKGAGDVE